MTLYSARDLARDQLGVVDDLDLARAERAGPLQPEQQRPVLGLVVGRLADVVVRAGELVAVGVRDHDPDAGRPGIAARTAVDVDDDALWRAGERQRLLGGTSILGKLPWAAAAAVAQLALAATRAAALRRSLLRRSTITSTLGSSL